MVTKSKCGLADASTRWSSPVLQGFTLCVSLYAEPATRIHIACYTGNLSNDNIFVKCIRQEMHTLDYWTLTWCNHVHNTYFPFWVYRKTSLQDVGKVICTLRHSNFIILLVFLLFCFLPIQNTQHQQKKVPNVRLSFHLHLLCLLWLRRVWGTIIQSLVLLDIPKHL